MFGISEFVEFGCYVRLRPLYEVRIFESGEEGAFCKSLWFFTEKRARVAARSVCESYVWQSREDHEWFLLYRDSVVDKGGACLKLMEYVDHS